MKNQNNSKNYHSKSILKLIQMCKDDDQLAFGELYKRYIKYIKLTVKSFVSNNEEVEEIVNDVFIKAFESLDSYTKDLSFGYWLKAIAKNRSIDHLRRHKLLKPIRINIDEDSNTLNNHTDGVTPETKFLKISDQLQLHHFVSKLRYKDRNLFELRYRDNYKYEEIANKLNVNIGTVKRQIHNVKQKLARLYKEVEPIN